MLFIAILVIVGLVKRQAKNYWFAVVFAFGFQVLMNHFFNGQTGIITNMVPDEGLNRLLMAGPVIVVAWGVPLYAIKKAYVKPLPKAEPPENKAA